MTAGKRHVNIPVFIPHLGCPNDCIFCNQRSISGKRSFDEDAVKDGIEAALATVPDCEAMRDAFGRCSGLLHSAASALNRPLPRPETLKDEIDSLTAWADDMRQRQNAARLS